MTQKSTTHTNAPRPLTQGERAIAHSVFGNHLDLDDIRLTTAWWVLRGYAVSPNGWVYFHRDDFCADFSDKSLHIRAWLVHELTHVWQIQQGMAVVRRAIFNRKYGYEFKKGKSFFNYGIEQQAKMVEDFYVRRELGKDCSAWRECVPFLA
ncbi:type IV secretion protein Rhs [Moraxella nasibovis]|uniref:type IV secretion protein Rhs n=1 Tax=Moraxella nasibovis TaxID=2904120 RepID=UPI00240ECE42|nr:type IV secretion protein Rhs [Moraxella nasibovis]WFF38641.1 type IV secretion protein Rhs [Moraxella nasibovis]